MYYSIYYINLDQLFQKVNIPKAISGNMCPDILIIKPLEYSLFEITDLNLCNK